MNVDRRKRRDTNALQNEVRYAETEPYQRKERHDEDFSFKKKRDREREPDDHYIINKHQRLGKKVGDPFNEGAARQHFEQSRQNKREDHARNNVVPGNVFESLLCDFHVFVPVFVL